MPKLSTRLLLRIIGSMFAAMPAAIGFEIPPSIAQQPAMQGALTFDAQTYVIARDAYLYAYPIVSMDMTMRQATNVPNAAAINMRAPVNQFAHARSFPRGDEKDAVRLNFDTLYSLAWIDLSREPIVLSVPDTDGRYYLLPMMDMWTDVFSVVGSRTTGTKAGAYAIVGPGWSGAMPESLRKIVAPTSTIWIVGRTQTTGAADYARAHKVQDGYRLTPLSQLGTDYMPPKYVPVDASIDNTTPPQVQVNRLDGIAMLTRLADLMVKYPPHPDDHLLLRLRTLGIEPGKPFDAAKLDPRTIAIINQAAKDTLESMPEAMTRSGDKVNGWNIGRENMGTYGTSYLRRANTALGALGANPP
jgi:hypothetical protein